MRAERAGHRREPPQISPQSDEEEDEEKDWNWQQVYAQEKCDGGYGRHHVNQPLRQQEQAGIDHQIELLHVVCGTSHDVADALLAVIGLALAEQIDVELVAHVAFHAERHNLGRVVCQQLQHASEYAEADNGQSKAEEHALTRVCSRNGIESIAHQLWHLNGGNYDAGAQEGTDHHVPRIAQCVAYQPPPDRGTVIGKFGIRREFAIVHLRLRGMPSNPVTSL